MAGARPLPRVGDWAQGRGLRSSNTLHDGACTVCVVGIGRYGRCVYSAVSTHQAPRMEPAPRQVAAVPTTPSAESALKDTRDRGSRAGGIAEEPTCAAPSRSTKSSTVKRTRSEPEGRGPEDETLVHESRFGDVVGRVHRQQDDGASSCAAGPERSTQRQSGSANQGHEQDRRSGDSDDPERAEGRQVAASSQPLPAEKSSIRRRTGVKTSMVPANRLGRRLVVDTKTRPDPLVRKPQSTEPSGRGGEALIQRRFQGRTERHLEPNPRVGAQSLRSRPLPPTSPIPAGEVDVPGGRVDEGR